MKPFELFKPGKQTSSAGKTIDFGESELQAAVAAYDPTLHEAPIVVGHPKDNGPAYGWIKSLSYADGVMVAEPIQVDEQFAEMVVKGRFKKRSASFYTPDSPHNPKPGVFYLRHVGFLGAQPPAVKGLKDVSFADAEDGVVEFADSYVVANVFRRMREWIIGKFSVEEADNVIPNWLITDLEAEARKESEAAQSAVSPAFNEGDLNMDFKEQHAAEKARADGLQAKLDAKEADFAEREKALAQREQAIARTAVENEIDGLVKAGKLLPAQKAQAVEFAMSLNAAELVIEFKEGDKTEKLSQRAAYLKQLAAAPKVVDYQEHSADHGEATGGKTNVATMNADLLAQVAGKK